MFKFFKRKSSCKWSELPKVDEIIAEMNRTQSQRTKKRRDDVIFLIQEAAEKGVYKCSAFLEGEDIDWLATAGYKIASWGNGMYEISWGED